MELFLYKICILTKSICYKAKLVKNRIFMKSVELKYSKTKIDQAGEVLKNKTSSDDDIA